MSFEGYVENDYPHLLPLHIPCVALKIKDSEGYGLSDFSAWSDWRSTDLFPNGNRRVSRTTRQLSENAYAFISCILLLNTVYI